MVAYGWKTVSLPIGLELLDFEVKRNEGSDSPAGFKSTLRVVTADGETATGSCWMNHPFSYPGNLVAHLDGTYLQNFSGVLESGKSRSKHRADFARSRLAIEMDRFTARGDRRVHDVLSSAIPKTNRRRTDHVFGSEAKESNSRTRCSFLAVILTQLLAWSLWG